MMAEYKKGDKMLYDVNNKATAEQLEYLDLMKKVLKKEALDIADDTNNIVDDIDRCTLLLKTADVLRLEVLRAAKIERKLDVVLRQNELLIRLLTTLNDAVEAADEEKKEVSTTEEKES